jgi:acyl carrier protein
MSLEEIQSIVLDVLREVQTISGRTWTGLDPSAKPIEHLEGFDSLSSVEATVMVEEKLGCRDLGVDSVFVSEDGNHALTVRQIAQRISILLMARGGKV